jgi:hypothetical protein
MLDHVDDLSVVTFPVASTAPVGKGDACRDGTGDDEDEERKDALHGSSFGRMAESHTKRRAAARLQLASQAG